MRQTLHTASAAFCSLINDSKLGVKMPQALINPTLTGINQTIEDVLDDYPVHPYQSAFLLPELRQKLVAHILSQVSHPLIEGLQAASNAAPVPHYSQLQVRLRTEMLVRGSILHILRENAVWLNRHLPGA